MRKIVSFNDNWVFIKEDLAFDKLKNTKGETVSLPHTWNGIDGQDGNNDFYRGRCHYVKNFKRPEGERVFVKFHAVNSSAQVFLNGKLLASHDGGYSIFTVELTQDLLDENELVVSADNSANQHVYPQFADFTFYGGIYRNVELISLSNSHFSLEDQGSSGIYITPVVDGKNAKVKIETLISNAQEGDLIRVRILTSDNELLLEKTQNVSDNVFNFLLEDVRLWNGRIDPYLYKVEAVLFSNQNEIDKVETKFGVREFYVDPDKGFFLNGKSYPLRGVSRHQDRLDVGNALTYEDMEEDMRLIHEMGTNYIRLAHYQHDQYFYDLCDEYGMVVWAEIPFISRYLPKADANALSQMQELVKQNYNHASILFWGLSNEISIGGEVTEELLEIHNKLNDFCHGFDPVRLTVMASVSMLPSDSPINNIPDLVSYNHYFGWYGGHVDDNAVWFDNFHKDHPTRPLGISEYGCEAILTWHTSDPKMGDYSEEYQAFYHEELLKTFADRDYLWSTAVWNMFDFGSDMRNEGGVMGRNNKGLVTIDRKIKKDSYYIYKAWWCKEPFVHLCGRRYYDRAEKLTQVKVYSNQDEVELLVNGKSLGKKQGAHIFTFDVPLKRGLNTIEARSGQLQDEIELNRVRKPNPDYELPFGDSEISNWFDEDGKKITFEFPEGYLSVKDSINDIMNNPEGAQVIQAALDAMGQQLEESDMKIPKSFMKMIGSFSIERLFGMSGMMGTKLPKELLLELNQKLTKIKK